MEHRRYVELNTKMKQLREVIQTLEEQREELNYKIALVNNHIAVMFSWLNEIEVELNGRL